MWKGYINCGARRHLFWYGTHQDRLLIARIIGTILFRYPLSLAINDAFMCFQQWNFMPSPRCVTSTIEMQQVRAKMCSVASFAGARALNGAQLNKWNAFPGTRPSRDVSVFPFMVRTRLTIQSYPDGSHNRHVLNLGITPSLLESALMRTARRVTSKLIQAIFSFVVYPLSNTHMSDRSP